MRQLFFCKPSLPLLSGAIFLLLTACGSPPPQDSSSLTPSVTIQAFHHKNLEQVFSEHRYSWNKLEQGVPPLILKQFPADLHLIRSVREKKELFFRTLLPMAMLANEEIREQRLELQNLISDYDREGFITAYQETRLAALKKRYRFKGDPLANLRARKRLFGRIDIIPEALVLAQAANESAWGTSRFALQANNIFGEWTFTPGTGLIPEDRPQGATYEVRMFPNLYQSVRAYMRNINTHRAYAKLRVIRSEMRKSGMPLFGTSLTSGLINYSTRREAYAREIRAMIRSNRLEQKIARTFLRASAIIPEPAEPTPASGLFSSRELLRQRHESL